MASFTFTTSPIHSNTVSCARMAFVAKTPSPWREVAFRRKSGQRLAQVTAVDKRAKGSVRLVAQAVSFRESEASTPCQNRKTWKQSHAQTQSHISSRLLTSRACGDSQQPREDSATSGAQGYTQAARAQDKTRDRPEDTSTRTPWSAFFPAPLPRTWTLESPTRRRVFDSDDTFANSFVNLLR